MPFSIFLVFLVLSIAETHKNKLNPLPPKSEPRLKQQKEQSLAPFTGDNTPYTYLNSNHTKNFCSSLALSQLGLFESLKDSKNYFIKKDVKTLYQYPSQQKIAEMDVFKQKTLIIGDEFSPFVMHSIRPNALVFALDTVYNDPTIIHKDFIAKFKKFLYLGSPLNVSSDVPKNFMLTLGHEVFKKFTNDFERKMIILNAYSLLIKGGQSRFIIWDGEDKKNVKSVKEWTSNIKDSAQIILEKISLKFIPTTQTNSTQTCQYDETYYLLKILKISTK